MKVINVLTYYDEKTVVKNHSVQINSTGYTDLTEIVVMSDNKQTTFQVSTDCLRRAIDNAENDRKRESFENDLDD